MGDIKLVDSFWYPTSGIMMSYPQVTTNWTVVAGGGRRPGSNSLRAGGATGDFEAVLGASYKYWIIGAGVKVSNYDSRAIFAIKDAGTLNTELRVNSGGQLYVARNGTALFTSSYVIPKAAWTHLEVSIGIDDAAGFFQVRVDGSATPIIDLTNIDTRHSSNASGDRIFLHASFDKQYCDLFVKASNVNNLTFEGDLGVSPRLLSGNGASSQGVGNDGDSTDNYLLVADALNNIDLNTYVDFLTAGHQDTYQIEVTPAGVTSIRAVSIAAVAKKTDTGNAVESKLLLRQGSTDYLGAVQFVQATGDAIIREVWDTQPNGAGAWTTAAFDACEAGIRRVV